MSTSQRAAADLDLLTDEAFHEAAVDRAAFTYTRKPGPPTPLRSWFSSEQVLTVAATAQGRRLNLVEDGCRAWATASGIPVPTVQAAATDGAWLLAEAVPAGHHEGPAYVTRALEVADRISALPRPELDLPHSEWRAQRRDLPMRLARGIVGRLPMRRFVRARAAAAGLGDLTTSHGDFYRRNVLPTARGVAVIDWEFMSRQPRWTDHVRLWSTLRRPQDRELAWEWIVSGRTSEEREHLATLTEWLTLRLLAENLAAPRAQRDQADLAHARVVVREARALTAALR